MAGKIAITAEELRSQATHYTQGADGVDNILSDLKSTQEQIRAEWQGSAFEQYDVRFQELSGEVTKFSQLLRDIKDQLDKTAQAYEENENNVKQVWGK